MAIFRPQEPTRDYSKSARTWARDPRISAKAKGILTNITSHSPTYELTFEQIVAEMKDDERAVRSGIKELETSGYLKRWRRRNEDGTLGGYDWQVIDYPDVFAGQDQGTKTQSGSEQGKRGDSAGSDHTAKVHPGRDQGKHDVSAAQSHSAKSQSGSDQEEDRVSAGGDHTAKRRTKKTKNIKEEDQKNTTSLSARTSVTAAREDANNRERDEPTTSEDPKPNTPDYQVLAEEGVDTDEAHQLIPVIVEQCRVRTPAFWRHVQRNRDIVKIIADARAWLATNGHSGCGHCGGTGKTTAHDQWDHPYSADCPACTPMTSDQRRAFVAQLAGQPCCDHGWEGGNLPMPHTGWMRCPDCRRASGYVPVEERDRQRRSSDRESAEERNMRGWMTTPLRPDVPVTHPQHPRRMINSHANQDR
ncbi:hypothetical protein ACFYUR_19135 [Micromonospora haikouensis]|uniref:hypothetical protein n=1 Tax=Micromonospora haikouensis TaxID=686309 RepID=UPI0036C5DEBF